MTFFAPLFTLLMPLFPSLPAIVGIDPAGRDDDDIGVSMSKAADRERRRGQKKEEDAGEARQKNAGLGVGFHPTESSNGCAILRLSPLTGLVADGPWVSCAKKASTALIEPNAELAAKAVAIGAAISTSVLAAPFFCPKPACHDCQPRVDRPGGV